MDTSGNCPSSSGSSAGNSNRAGNSNSGSDDAGETCTWYKYGSSGAVESFTEMLPGAVTVAAAVDVDNTGFATCNGKLRVDGVQLVNAAGEAVQLLGMSSHGLAWFPSCYTKASIQYLVEHWGINMFRPAMYIGGGNGYADTLDDELLHEIVKWCKELGIYVLIDWHILTPGNPNDWLAGNNNNGVDAAAWFGAVADRYKGETHVLYEIANEPNGVEWAGANGVKEYADAVIAAIRQVDAATVVMVGTPNWSQDIHLAAADPVDQPANVMYSFHFYACTHGFLLSRLQEHASKIPIFVTEWGMSSADGNDGTCFDTALAYLESFNGAHGQVISWAQWSYADKPEASAALAPGACGTQSWDRTSCSGDFLKRYIKGNVQTCRASSATTAATTAVAAAAATTVSAAATAVAATTAPAPAPATTTAEASTASDTGDPSDSVEACVGGVADYRQCGGANHAGSTCCGSASFSCQFGNQWYSQCRPTTVGSETDAGSSKPAADAVATTTAAAAAATTVPDNGGSVTQQGCVPAWGKCGGIGHTADTCCEQGWTCNRQNRYYHQCVRT